jgi:DNA-binding transcriptional LysR family regulator
MKEHPSLHALALFLATVEHGTMTAAAEAEGIAQPAISVHIRKLERYYGMPLVERSGRRVRPTAAGEQLATHVRRILGLVDEAEQALTDLAGLRGGRLVVGASATVAETWLPVMLGRFRRRYPAVALAVRSGNSEQVLQAVHERAVGFGIIGRPDDDPALLVQPVFEDRIELFVAANHPLAGAAGLSLHDLAQTPFVLREAGSATRETVLRCMREANFAPAHAVHLGSNEAVKRAVAAGLGMGVLSAGTLDVDMRAGDVRIVPCADWDCHRQFWLVRRADRVLSRAEQTFLTLLQGHLARARSRSCHQA